MVTYPINNTSYTAEDARIYEANRTSGLYSANDFNYNIGDGLSINIEPGAAWFAVGTESL